MFWYSPICVCKTCYLLGRWHSWHQEHNLNKTSVWRTAKSPAAESHSIEVKHWPWVSIAESWVMHTVSLRGPIEWSLTQSFKGFRRYCQGLHVDVRASSDVASGALVHDVDVDVTSLLLLWCNSIIHNKGTNLTQYLAYDSPKYQTHSRYWWRDETQRQYAAG